MAAQTPVMNVMMRASEKAARTLLRDFNEVEHLQVSQKGPGDFVTAADRRSEEIIFEELKKARPDYSFLMEESGAVAGKDSDYRWIIDPLDGTTNFLHGIPHWAISIALEHKGQIIAGLIHDPVKDEIFHAEKGKGAFMRRSRLRVSGRNDLMHATIATGAPRRSQAQKNQFIAEYTAMLSVAPGLRRFGAAALDLAYVAAGRYEGFWERDLKAWDIAAGILIVKESGGFISDLDDIRKNPVDTGNILAANEQLFDSIGKVLKAVK
ncbi:MAG: inositol monophosphatase [Alphaproteobacteria bacterium]|nr:MAG: inositol monophosphatase [Alphaproteobacteria bacterium]